MTDPPRRGRDHWDALADCFKGLGLPTAGVVPGWEREENDHIATGFLRHVHVQGWPNVIDGVRCSDHAGVMADLARHDRLAG